jgi:hypothetical protein
METKRWGNGKKNSEGIMTIETIKPKVEHLRSSNIFNDKQIIFRTIIVVALISLVMGLIGLIAMIFKSMNRKRRGQTQRRI